MRLPADGAEVVIGRNPDQGIELSWDPQVSRVHAVLERIGGVWTVEDDGLSRNGTSVNGVRSTAAGGCATRTCSAAAA